MSIGGPIQRYLAEIPVIDHHCHGLMKTAPTAAEFTDLATESDWPQPAGGSVFDSPVGVAMRARCAPLLGLEKHADGESYLAARSALGAGEVHRRLLTAACIGTYIVDTGFQPAGLLSPSDLAGITGSRSHEIVRLEAIAEAIASEGATNGADFADVFGERLHDSLKGAVGVKSVIAYRYGLDFDPTRPTDGDVRAAAGRWLDRVAETSHARLEEPALLRAILWAAVDAGKPIQMHVGYGDSDVILHRCDPTKMTSFLQATVDVGTPIMLLHNYPYVREAGYLSQVYPHVYLDVGAAVGYTGASSRAVIAQALELSPLSKLLFSTDAYGLAELYLLGSQLLREGLGAIFDNWIERDDMSVEDAKRYAHMIAAGNAARVYGLERA